MSYRNPKIFMPDPTTFSKGFESTLQYGVELFAKQKKEKEDFAEKAEQAESILLSATDLGGYKDLDKKIYDSFQNNIRGIVDAGEFAKATPARKQEMLEEIRNLKQGFEKLQSVISTPADEIDARNEDVLKLKLQLAKDPTKIKVIGSGANMSLTWSGAEGVPTNEISVSGLTSKRIINIKQFEEPLRDFDSKSLQSATAEMMNGAKLGRYDDAKNVARSTYSTNLQSNLTDEQYAYIYTNKLKLSEKWQATPEQKEEVLAYKQKEFKIKLDAQDPRAELYKPLPPTPKSPTAAAIKAAEKEVKFTNMLNDFNKDPFDALKQTTIGSNVSKDGNVISIVTAKAENEDEEDTVLKFDITNFNEKAALSKLWASNSGLVTDAEATDFNTFFANKSRGTKGKGFEYKPGENMDPVEAFNTLPKSSLSEAQALIQKYSNQ